VREFGNLKEACFVQMICWSGFKIVKESKAARVSRHGKLR
jgi:hypothetical protein